MAETPEKKKQPRRVKSISPEPSVQESTQTRLKKAELDFSRYEKFRAAEAYFSSLQETNQRSLQYFQDTIQHTFYAFYASIILYVLTYVTTLGALIAGLVLILDPNTNRLLWATGCLIGGGGLLVLLINRDPIRSSRHFVNNLARLNIVFTGFIRQIHQVDATFRGIFLSTDEYTIDDMELMLARVHESVEDALDNINQVLEDLED
jgi:hypothetical protein